MIRLPLEFRQSYVMAWVVGTVFYAWMFWCFIEKGYVQVCFMLCSLRPYTCESWTIKFVSPLEAVPECPLQSAALWALQVWGKAHNKKNFRDTGILYILIWVRESPIYTCIKIHQVEYFFLYKPLIFKMLKSRKLQIVKLCVWRSLESVSPSHLYNLLLINILHGYFVLPYNKYILLLIAFFTRNEAFGNISS